MDRGDGTGVVFVGEWSLPFRKALARCPELLRLELFGSLPILFRDLDSPRFVRVLENKLVRLPISALLLGDAGFGGVGGVGDSPMPGLDFLRVNILFNPEIEDFLLMVGELSSFEGTGGPMGSVGGGESGGDEGKS